MTIQTSPYTDDPTASFPCFGVPTYALHSYYVGGDGNVLVWNGAEYTARHGLTQDIVADLVRMAGR